MKLWIKPLIVLLGIIIAWQILVPAMEIPKWLLPSPADIVLRFGEDYPTIFLSTVKTLSVVLAGFGISVIVGVFLGIAIAEWAALREAL